jgi:hypothetical protein
MLSSILKYPLAIVEDPAFIELQKIYQLDEKFCEIYKYLSTYQKFLFIKECDISKAFKEAMSKYKLGLCDSISTKLDFHQLLSKFVQVFQREFTSLTETQIFDDIIANGEFFCEDTDTIHLIDQFCQLH